MRVGRVIGCNDIHGCLPRPGDNNCHKSEQTRDVPSTHRCPQQYSLAAVDGREGARRRSSGCLSKPCTQSSGGGSRRFFCGPRAAFLPTRVPRCILPTATISTAREFGTCSFRTRPAATVGSGGGCRRGGHVPTAMARTTQGTTSAATRVGLRGLSVVTRTCRPHPLCLEHCRLHVHQVCKGEPSSRGGEGHGESPL